jgi:hypothetical protein
MLETIRALLASFFGDFYEPQYEYSLHVFNIENQRESVMYQSIEPWLCLDIAESRNAVDIKNVYFCDRREIK